jgi:hypothetical protein
LPDSGCLGKRLRINAEDFSVFVIYGGGTQIMEIGCMRGLDFVLQITYTIN